MRNGPCVAILALVLAGCQSPVYVAENATRPYPLDRHATRGIDVQVFRDGPWLEVVNSTARSYHDFDLWINQRYVRHVQSMSAGQTLRLRLNHFYDERGEAIVAGGFFRTRTATPVRLVQIETGPEDPLIGLVTIRAEDIER